jgi:hypothetical protein
MPIFDVSKEWVILIPPQSPAGRQYGEELSRAIDMLRKQARVLMPSPGLEDASRFGSDDSTPIILLNAEPDRKKSNGFSWRLGRDRLEIYGPSERGLCNGIFDFLATLGMRWPRPNEALSLDRGRVSTILPPIDRVRPWEYPLQGTKGYQPANTHVSERRRLFLDRTLSPKQREAWILWAAQNKIDGVVFPLPETAGLFAGLTGNQNRSRDSLVSLAETYALIVEEGGWDLPLLVPRRYFYRNPELFRMKQGKRDRRINFCATNPDTLDIIRHEAAKLFREHPKTGVFHLWPERGHERIWCACPSCRAFSPEEQNRIAVNCAADVLAEINPAARISYYEKTDEQIDIRPRPNMFGLTKLPDERDAESAGLFWATALL